MSGRKSGGGPLERVGERIGRWRSEHGGPGVRWPEDLWAEAVEAARIAGVETAARTLGLDRARLAARVAREGALTSDKDRSSFVEVDASRLCLAPQVKQTLLRFEGADGERLEIELGDGSAVDIVGLARAFWSRRA